MWYAFARREGPASRRYILRVWRSWPELYSSDDALLNYNDDDGQKIEPTYYMPVIPTVLINAPKVSTGWSTSIPNYNLTSSAASARF